jgi:peptide chain release factor subunit 3
MDEPSVKWNVERYNEIVGALKPFLQQSGYNPETDCHFVPCSGLSGENILNPAPPTTCTWYKDGRSVIQILNDMPIPPRDENAPLRVPVLDKMTDKGVIVFGKIESGQINLGDGLKIMPSGNTCQVVTIFNSKEQAVRYAKPGENVKLRISLDSKEKVNKGDVLCLRDQTPAPITELFEAEVHIMELLKYKPILSKGYQCILHLHTIADEATVKEILTAYEMNDHG